MMKAAFFRTATALFCMAVLCSCSGGQGNGGKGTHTASPKRVLAKNVLLKSVANSLSPRSANADEVDSSTVVLAENVVYENTTGQGDITATNVEEALTETNVQLSAILPGKWHSLNLGRQKTAEVTFNADGTYKIDSGYFEAGGSWCNDATVFVHVYEGTYTIHDDIIAFYYKGWNTDVSYVSRFALVLYKRPNKLTIAVQGHTHGVELLEKVE